MGRVALIGENSIEYVSTLIDIWNSGNSAVLIDWRIPIQIAIEMMLEAEVYKCYIDKKFFEETLVAATKGIVFVSFERKSFSAEYLPDTIYNKFKPDYSTREAIVLYSSGTTGKSKGIILSHFAINTNADSIIDYMKPTADDCIYIAKNLSHSSTLTGELLVALKTRARLVISPTIVPPRYIISKMNALGVTIVCLNPTLLSMIADELEEKKIDLITLRAIYVSGSILNDKVYCKARKVFANVPTYNAYGLSEAGPRITAQRLECCKSNSVGKPINGVKIALVDEKGNLVETGERGIIHVNTPSIFSGYVCGKAKHRSLYSGWLNTGDIGVFDINRELLIVGRVDDMIIIDAHKIYPSTVEKQVLLLSGVSECAVVDACICDKTFLSCLYTGTLIDETAARKQLEKNLMKYEIPKFFIHNNEIPRNINGKILKTDVKRIVEKRINEQMIANCASKKE